MKYPLELSVETNPQGKVKCICKSTGRDFTSTVTWITKQNAIQNGNDLYKEDENSKFKQVPKSGGSPRKASVTDKVMEAPQKRPDRVTNSVQVMQFKHDEALKQKPTDLIINDLTWKIICRDVIRGKNVLLTGSSGCGKSQTAFSAAAAMGRELFYINLGATQDPRGALIGCTHFAKETGTIFSESAFVKAIQKPNTVVLLDEVSRAHPEAWNILMTVLDPLQRYLRLDEAIDTPTVKVAEGVCFIGTANIGSEYTATRIMDRALLERFSIIEIPQLDARGERFLLQQLFPSLCADISDAIAEIAVTSREELKSDAARVSTSVSTRTSIEVAELVVDGFSLEEAVEVTVYPLFSESGGLQSERTFMKQLVQKFINDQTSDTLVDHASK